MAGSINRTNQSLDQYLQQKLAKLESEFLQFKNAQPIGASALPLAIASLTSFGPLIIAAGGFHNFFIGITPASPLLTLWNFMFTVYVDSPDALHAFPYGVSLTPGQQAARVTGNADYLNFNRSTNAQAYLIRIENYDTVSHSYFIDFLTATPQAT